MELNFGVKEEYLQSEFDSITELIIGKNRSGPTKTIELLFKKA